MAKVTMRIESRLEYAADPVFESLQLACVLGVDAG
jgi:hypothetical protein